MSPAIITARAPTRSATTVPPLWGYGGELADLIGGPSAGSWLPLWLPLAAAVDAVSYAPVLFVLKGPARRPPSRGGSLTVPG